MQQNGGQIISDTGIEIYANSCVGNNLSTILLHYLRICGQKQRNDRSSLTDNIEKDYKHPHWIINQNEYIIRNGYNLIFTGNSLFVVEWWC